MYKIKRGEKDVSMEDCKFVVCDEVCNGNEYKRQQSLHSKINGFHLQFI